MNKHFEHLRIIRNHYDRYLSELSLEQLNRIPDGFGNNIIWNIGHALVTQQLLVYALSGNKMAFEDDFINTFRKGSKAGEVSRETVDFIKANLFTTIDQAEKDFAAGLFQKYKEYSTSFGLTLKDIEDAIIFNNIHEGVHLGYVMALVRV